ncbi:MAG: hypothetical protein AB7F28_04330 [Candidatus Margulisiibacteriota bacterium]
MAQTDTSQLSSAPGIIARAIAHSAYKLMLWLWHIPTYAKHRRLLFLDFFLPYYYAFYITPTRLETFKANTGKPLKELTEGQFTFVGLTQIFDALPLKPKSVFLDLGGGHGKPALYAAFIRRIQAISVDVVPIYARVGEALCQRLNIPNISWKTEDFLTTDVAVATVVLINTTCLGKKTIAALAQHLQGLSVGTWLVSPSAKLPGTCFKTRKTLKVPMSWGFSTVYIQQKVS